MFLVGIVLIGWAVLQGLEGGTDGGSPPPEIPRNPPPRAEVDAPAIWALKASTMRPDLDEEEANFETSFDGFSDTDAILDAGTTWLAVTLGEESRGNRLHGLDPDTGEEVWTRTLDGAYCARDLLDGQLACAEATDWERGLGVEWNLHLLDPASGDITTTQPFEGWLTAMVVDQGVLMVLEQRLPAPHALITGFDAALEQQWQLDLSQEEGHADLFSHNRVLFRAERLPAGPALDRPRIRRVADGLTAFWIGARTAFVDAPAGRLVGFPPCSRVVDDGQRIWCNDGNRTVAYDYQLRAITRTDDGVRLAFPHRDPVAGDITIPAFLDADGAFIKVDTTTGVSQGEFTDTAMSSAFGVPVSPTAATVNGLILAADSSQSIAVDGATQEILWQSGIGLPVRDPVVFGDNALLVEFNAHEVDLATGEIVNSWRLPLGYAVAAKGDGYISWDMADIARLDLE